jgi:hypothetical protein
MEKTGIRQGCRRNSTGVRAPRLGGATRHGDRAIRWQRGQTGFKSGPKRRVFEKTKHHAFKYWELERCLNDADCPIDRDTANNLRLLITLRHEIEHQMTRSLDNFLSGRYQACALNYNEYLKKLFGQKYGMDAVLTYSIQFVRLTRYSTSSYK